MCCGRELAGWAVYGDASIFHLLAAAGLSLRRASW